MDIELEALLEAAKIDRAAVTAEKKDEYIKFFKKMKPSIMKNKYEIVKLLRTEIDNFERYYISAKFCDSRKVFSEANVNLLVGAMDIKPDEFVARLREIANPQWNVLNDKAVMSLLIICATFYSEGLRKELYYATLHLTHRFISGLMVKFFPHGCKQETFDYTLNRITSKFLIREKNGSVNIITSGVAKDHMEKFSPFLEAKEDRLFVYYALYIRTRLNSAILNFSKEYYKTDSEGLKMSANVTITDDSGEDISSFSNDTSVILGKKNNLIDRMNSFKSIAVHEQISKAVGNETTSKFFDKLFKAIFEEKFLNSFSEAYIALLFNKRLNSSVCLNDARRTIVQELDRKTSSNNVREMMDNLIAELDTEHVLNEVNKKILRAYIILTFLYYYRSVNCKK